jgi:ubiquinol-cytochrome c reductase cytochrome c1 subunit
MQMKNMSSMILFLYLFFGGNLCFALDSSPVINMNDKASLQRGAALFMNYCSGCHSLKYIQYNQMGDDLGIVSSKLLKNNLIFTQSKSSDPIEIALPPIEAQQWFGRVPPDLSLTARQRGASWLYRYLTGFYQDRNRPFGVNNLLIPNAAMPDVLEALKGTKYLVMPAAMQQPFLKTAHHGEVPVEEFEQVMSDLINFLVYVSEPAQLSRLRIGPFILLFFIILLLPIYYLKIIYWRRT